MTSGISAPSAGEYSRLARIRSHLPDFSREGEGTDERRSAQASTWIRKSVDAEDARVADFDPTRIDPEQLTTIAGHVRAIIEELGLDIEEPNLTGTDLRVAKMYLEMFHGLRGGREPRVTTFPNAENYQHMVMERDIPFYSMCSHHFVPFYGQAHIAYIPEDRIIGLSKFSRILEFYARDLSCRSG